MPTILDDTRTAAKNKKLEESSLPEGPWDRLWVSLMRSPWASIAVVPAAPGLSALDLARDLARVGSDYLGRKVRFKDATGLHRSDGRDVVKEVAAITEPHQVVVAVDAPLESQTALLVARAASTAVLVVGLETTSLADARRTLEMLGAGRVAGAVSVADAGQ